ncbi:hypothetical protein BJ875DRAFT_487867 [Amylocarpus encephaloides]|uniref:Uncharacterized protein n=1 Tax=Amylocarpus encephaloides TaxID=45428 RepID=A0A9P7YBT6_9HELO|nr:hypothetical protein BJ875DRAFT_487867 [Amylocarpus encephaloides]
MAKSLSRTASGQTRVVGGVRGRDVEFPRAPIRVRDAAQAKAIEINIVRKFELAREITVPERPKTSAGTSTKAALQRTKSTRETKDDIYFNPLGVHGSGTTFYDFPLPGSHPNQHLTSQDFALPPRKSSRGARPLTPRGSSLSPPLKSSQGSRPVTPEVVEVEQASMVVPSMEIGMALGSPSHPPSDWPQQRHTENIRHGPSPDIMSESTAGVAAPAKVKASRWKILGGLFGGKKQSEPQQQPFYQLQPAPSSHNATVVRSVNGPDYLSFGEPPPAPNEEPTKSRNRGRSISTRKTKQKASKLDMKRANTLPTRYDHPEVPQEQTPEIRLDGQAIPNITSGNHHILNVDIPSVEMERYSIMFGSVLQKPTGNGLPLLERRQATLDRLKSVNEALAAKEKELREKEKGSMARRATSPQFTKSPAFSLFPNTPSQTGHRDREASPSRTRRHGPSGSLQRSNTSPAVLSPARPTFAPRLDNEAHATLIAHATAVAASPNIDNDSPTIPLKDPTNKGRSTSMNSLPANPKSKQPERSLSPEESHMVLCPSEDEGDYSYKPSPLVTHDAAPMKPKLVEPAWEIVNKPSEHTPFPKSATSNPGSDHSVSTSLSSTSGASVSTVATSVSVPIIFKQGPSKAQPSQQQQTRIPINNPHSRRNPSNASTVSVNSADEEARLKSAADVSIARQISVSRQQRQLLVPINAMRRTPSNASVSKKPSQSTLSSVPSSSSSLEVNCIASPLNAIAVAASEERDSITPKPSLVGDRKERLLVTNIKPSMPTLVVVPGPKDNERVDSWVGNITTSAVVHPGTPVQFGLSLAERRKGKGHVQMGDIQVGLAPVSRSGGASSRIKETVRGASGLQHRQRISEGVVVERVSVASN